MNEAEQERLRTEEEHKLVSAKHQVCLAQVAKYEKELRRHINKSKPYFDTRVEFTRVLENQKDLIHRLELEIKQKKKDYARSLRRLEEISEEIHETRFLGERGEGVGSETPGKPMSKGSTPSSENYHTVIDRKSNLWWCAQKCCKRTFCHCSPKLFRLIEGFQLRVCDIYTLVNILKLVCLMRFMHKCI